jgi:hypothetical protein
LWHEQSLPSVTLRFKGNATIQARYLWGRTDTKKRVVILPMKENHDALFLLGKQHKPAGLRSEAQHPAKTG